jgi:hypothetical protein
MEARTFPAICLGPAKNLQGSYYFLNIQSWKILRRRSFTKMPISNENIQRINLKAGRDWELYGRQGLTFRFQEVDVNDFEEEGEAEDNQDDDPATPVADVEDVQPLPVENNQEVNYEPDYFVEDEEEEVDYEPNYFTQEPEEPEEPEAPEEHFDEPVQQQTPYNLRDTAERRRRRGQLGLLQNIVLSTYNVSKGLKVWGKEAEDSMKVEMLQLHQKGVFEPVDYSTLTPREKLRILRTLMFLKRKRSGLLKSRFLADGSIERLCSR